MTTIKSVDLSGVVLCLIFLAFVGFSAIIGYATMPRVSHEHDVNKLSTWRETVAMPVKILSVGPTSISAVAADDKETHFYEFHIVKGYSFVHPKLKVGAVVLAIYCEHDKSFLTAILFEEDSKRGDVKTLLDGGGYNVEQVR